MVMRYVFAAAAGSILLAGCGTGGNAQERQVVQEVSGAVNPYLWRASLDTLDDLPLDSQPDPVGGVIVYDWKSFEDAPDERIKATVYILDTRLRADGVKVSVFRQVRRNGSWEDAQVDPATPVQLENKILERARRLKVAELQ
ncbi:MAG: DUF3576 domain-containing protein [Alphaproteobacteria bacterium]|jgi:hypothetical protein|nr:DUF3576 domain-containing protein [Alphaproteobacteria bacterium]